VGRQTDENEIGLTYEELDAILPAIESGKVGGFGPAKVQRIRDLMAGSEHKRQSAPIFRDE